MTLLLTESLKVALELRMDEETTGEIPGWSWACTLFSVPTMGWKGGVGVGPIYEVLVGSSVECCGRWSEASIVRDMSRSCIERASIRIMQGTRVSEG